MNKRPDTFDDWRALWWSNLRELGMLVEWHVRTEHRLTVTREIWELTSRIRRLHQRMEVEREAKTGSYQAALGQALLRELRRMDEP